MTENTSEQQFMVLDTRWDPDRTFHVIIVDLRPDTFSTDPGNSAFDMQTMDDVREMARHAYPLGLATVAQLKTIERIRTSHGVKIGYHLTIPRSGTQTSHL